MLKENIAHLEKREMAVTFATGILGLLAKSGDEIITHATLYDVQFRYSIIGIHATILQFIQQT